ncbi:hypothetical protein, partial [Mycolicibacter sinensis]|uniref:hypothetical protein n=1 Tax=Mycolicibacter sinensis (strain JDM601) TaxID=875328 RepID=UPI0010425F14
MSYLLGKPGKRRARGRRGELRTAPAALGILTAVGLATLTSVPAARADFDDLWADLFDPSAWGNLSDDFNGLFVAADPASDRWTDPTLVLPRSTSTHRCTRPCRTG